MGKSNNQAVQQFLDDIQMTAPEKYSILQAARAAVFSLAPTTSERFIYGGIMFSLIDDFGGIFASKHHVSFEFSQGYLFDDPIKQLKGTGKFRRHLKLQSLSDIDNKNIAGFTAQAVKFQDQ